MSSASGTDFLSDPWLAGFIDGEACFDLPRSHGANGARYTMRFSMGMRADERPLIEALHATLGGRLYDRQIRTSHIIEWHINRREQIAVLIEYLDRFPLRSKKRRDFDVWREAYVLIEEQGSGAEGLPDLRLRLVEGRKFKR